MTSSPDPERMRGMAWLPALLIGALLLIAAFTAFAITGGVGGLSAPVATATPEVPEAAHGGINPDGPAVEQISLAEARAHFDAGTAIFIDVRAGSAFSEGHIPGALTITSRELEQRLESLTPGSVIIAYGDASRPESGVRGAQIFMELGYPKVIALEGGFQAWRDAGHPVEAQDSVQSTTP
jgi:rhodanese-related sulfurtransferase